MSNVISEEDLSPSLHIVLSWTRMLKTAQSNKTNTSRTKKLPESMKPENKCNKLNFFVVNRDASFDHVYSKSRFTSESLVNYCIS